MMPFCTRCCLSASTATKDKSGQEEKKETGIVQQEIDRFGLYQVCVYAIISLPMLLSAGPTLSYVFTAGEVKYRCAVPECEDPTNTTLAPPWSVYSAPILDKGQLAPCSRYVVNKNPSDSCTNGSFTNETEACESWIYDPHEATIQSEWNITCDSKRWMLTLVGTVNNIGQFVGLIFTGYVSDRYGRRTVLTLATALSGVTGFVHSFAVNYWMFLAFEFIDAAISAGVYSAGFILGMEMTGAKNRVLGSTINSCMFGLGEILLGLIAMWLASWRVLLQVIYVPAMFAIFLPLLIPESVAWLLTKGKHEEVSRIYKKMAHVNGLRVSKDTVNAFKQINSVQSENKATVEGTKVPIVQVFKSSVILVRLLVCSFCWLTNTFVYYGLSLNSVAFAGDKYLNFILVSLVEIPAYLLTWVIIQTVGRKPTLCGSFLLSGTFCLAIQFVPPGTFAYAPLLLYMGGKMCITMAFSSVYVYTTEMFPTNLRHSLLGVCSMTGRVGSILAPQTPLLASIMPELPLILFGSMGLSAGFLSLIFPETLGTKLPDTVWEAENIGKKHTHREEQNPPP